MKEKLTKLIDLRTIITIITTIVLNIGFLTGKINAQEYLVFATMVYTFYFVKEKKEGNQ